ncbi:MAG: DUF5106 domain-containing protein [Bacteroidales bacterium]|jgi:thiol-disulfide isomerase/thioredoxin|nr:DUF5106 domain-containing protein [Bacteroidales bacterium]
MRYLSFSFMLVLLMIFSGVSRAQEYKIEVQVEGVSDTIMMLGHHFGEQKFVVDTVQADANGKAIFSGDEALDPGIYILVLPSMNNAYFELLVDDDQEFKLSTSTEGFVDFMEVKGSKTNVAFNEYQRRMSEVQFDVNRFQKRIQALDPKSDSVEVYKEKIREISNTRIDYMKTIVAENKDNLFGKIINAIIEPEIPEPPKDADGNITDSTFQYRYYRDHYFDNIDLTEPGLMRTPILKAKIDYYFKNVVPPVADTVIPIANKLIEASKPNEDMFRFMTSHLLNYFETSKIMGMDKVFVTLAENWYLSGQAFWADEELLEKIAERVKKIAPNFIGSIAPDIAKVPTFHNEFATLHEVDAEYVILVFYEPSCGHCKKIVPKLYEKYIDTLKNDNVEVFAVYTQGNEPEWREFIEEKEIDQWINVWDPYQHSDFRNNYDIYSTPVIYILDSEKRIVAKRIDVDYIIRFIEFDRRKKAKEKVDE